MGNAGGKQEHKTKQDLQATQLKSVALHEDGANIKFAFAPCFLAKEEQTLSGKSLVEDGRGGFVFVDSSNQPIIRFTLLMSHHHQSWRSFVSRAFRPLLFSSISQHTKHTQLLMHDQVFTINQL